MCEDKKERKKTRGTEFSSLQHSHGVEFNLQQKSTPTASMELCSMGKLFKATLLISIVVLTLTVASSEIGAKVVQTESE
jgi:hypothetical protein